MHCAQSHFSITKNIYINKIFICTQITFLLHSTLCSSPVSSVVLIALLQIAHYILNIHSDSGVTFHLLFIDLNLSNNFGSRSLLILFSSPYQINCCTSCILETQKGSSFSESVFNILKNFGKNFNFSSIKSDTTCENNAKTNRYFSIINS